MHLRQIFLKQLFQKEFLFSWRRKDEVSCLESTEINLITFFYIKKGKNYNCIVCRSNNSSHGTLLHIHSPLALFKNFHVTYISYYQTTKEGRKSSSHCQTSPSELIFFLNCPLIHHFKNPIGKFQSLLVCTVKSTTNRKPDNQDQKQQNSQNKQFNFHVLKPQFPTNLCSLLSEILSLKIRNPSALESIS